MDVIGIKKDEFRNRCKQYSEEEAFYVCLEEGYGIFPKNKFKKLLKMIRFQLDSGWGKSIIEDLFVIQKILDTEYREDLFYEVERYINKDFCRRKLCTDQLCEMIAEFCTYGEEFVIWFKHKTF